MRLQNITVNCPHCRSEQKFPYIYDGSYEVVCNNSGCYYRGGQFGANKVRRTFYILIREGTLHVWQKKEDAERFAKLAKKF